MIPASEVAFQLKMAFLLGAAFGLAIAVVVILFGMAFALHGFDKRLSK